MNDRSRDYYNRNITNKKEAEDFKEEVMKSTPYFCYKATLESEVYGNTVQGSFILSALGVWYAALYNVYTPEECANEVLNMFSEDSIGSEHSKYNENLMYCNIFIDILPVKQVVMPELAIEAFRAEMIESILCSKLSHFSSPVVRYTIDGRSAAVFFSVSGFDDMNDTPFCKNFVIMCKQNSKKGEEA